MARPRAGVQCVEPEPRGLRGVRLAGPPDRDPTPMSFVSYAQNFEDVMLRRALSHVERGFYNDVGANDPIVDSVTLAFYERGWRGINVEPMRQYHDRLVASRPRDTNLGVA